MAPPEAPDRFDPDLNAAHPYAGVTMRAATRENLATRLPPLVSGHITGDELARLCD